MIVRLIEPKDREIIEDIHKRHHKFPCPDLSLHCGSVLVEDDQGIIGAGVLKPILEAVMILDLDRPMRDKGPALTAMIQQAVFFGQKFPTSQIHSFVEDPKFVSVLRKHYDFNPPKGTSLVLEI